MTGALVLLLILVAFAIVVVVKSVALIPQAEAAVIERLEYDPNRTAFIALVRYEDGEQAYILAPQRLKVGDTVIAGERVDVKPGNAMPLKNIPVGTIVHNVELRAASWPVRPAPMFSSSAATRAMPS